MDTNIMISHVANTKEKLGVMNKFIFMASLFFAVNSAFTQNTNLSSSIGDVNNDYTYGKLIKALGIPDSIFSFDPKSHHPVPKSLAYNELYFDNNMFVVRFSYFMLDTLTKKTKSPSIEIFSGSKIKLNGDFLSGLDSAYIIRKYGEPASVNKNTEEFTISYNFREKKYFSLMTFNFNANGTIRKVCINFGNYP